VARNLHPDDPFLYSQVESDYYQRVYDEAVLSDSNFGSQAAKVQLLWASDNPQSVIQSEGFEAITEAAIRCIVSCGWADRWALETIVQHDSWPDADAWKHVALAVALAVSRSSAEDQVWLFADSIRDEVLRPNGDLHDWWLDMVGIHPELRRIEDCDT
jgi:hypothetical protein